MQPKPDLPADHRPPDAGPQPPPEGPRGAADEIPPGIQRSLAAFRRDLPTLLADKKLYRCWVAYHGDERIGIARSADELYRECFRRGLKREDFVVCWIMPEIPPDEECLAWFGP
jgi:hypothetical protein